MTGQVVPVEFLPEDPDRDLDLVAHAMCHSPQLNRWREYPACMRNVWRERFGLLWAEFLARPVATLGLPQDLVLEPGPEPEPERPRPPQRDNRPPDLPPVPKLPPAPATRQAPARARSGFLAALGQGS